MAVNYRGGIGYGMEFREAPTTMEATGASEFQDVLGAGLYLRNSPGCGWASAWGVGRIIWRHLSAMDCLSASDLFAAGVDIHGVHDGTSPGAPSYRVTIGVPILRRAGWLSSRRRWRSEKWRFYRDC